MSEVIAVDRRHTFVLTMDSPGGIPMSLAARLMETIGDWFPGTTMTEPGDQAMAFRIPWDEYREWLQDEYETRS